MNPLFDILSPDGFDSSGESFFSCRPEQKWNEQQAYDNFFDAAEKRAKAILECVENRRIVQGVQEQCALKIIEETERFRSVSRFVLPYFSEESIQKREDALNSFSNISFQNLDGAVLKIELFPLIKKPIKGSYNVYFEVKCALMKYLQKNPFDLDLEAKYTLVYRRIVPDALSLGRGKCDNDNFEMKRTTNAICESFGIADSIDKFSFYYTSAVGESAKTQIFLMREQCFLAAKMQQLFD